MKGIRYVMKNIKALKYLVVILLIIIIALGSYVVYSDFIKEDNLSLENNDIKDSIVRDFLATSSFISEQEVVSDEGVTGFCFLSNGNFAYSKIVYESDENQVISYRGTWKIYDNEILALTITEEEVAYNIVNSDYNFPYFTYDSKVNAVNKMEFYFINGVDNVNDRDILIIDNDVIWYQTGLIDNNSNLKVLASDGYSSYFEQKNIDN